MARLSLIVLGTSLCLSTIAAAQAGPWVWQRLWGPRVEESSPAAGAAASWSTTGPAVTRLQDWLKGHPAEDPAAAAAYAQLGSLYLQQARETGDPAYYAKAEQTVQRSLEIAPDNVPALVSMGTLQLARHQFADALATGQQARQRAPGAYAVYGVLGDAYTELGRYGDAVDAVQEMVDRRPDLASLSRVSFQRELHGDLAGAIAAMQQAADAGAPRSEGTAWTRVQLGNLYFTAGQLSEAELQYRYATTMLPDYAHGLAGLARIAAARGDLKQAAALYRRALDAVPWPDYAIALGDVHRALGDAAAARRDDDLVRVMARLQRAGGVDVDLEMALFEADRATDPDALAAAVEEARAQYARRPSVHAADVLGWTLYRAGRPAEALPYAREALRLGSSDPILLFHAGAIAFAAAPGDQSLLAEARGYLERATATQPHFSVRYAPEAARLLRSLQSGAPGTQSPASSPRGWGALWSRLMRVAP